MSHYKSCSSHRHAQAATTRVHGSRHYAPLACRWVEALHTAEVVVAIIAGRRRTICWVCRCLYALSTNQVDEYGIFIPRLSYSHPHPPHRYRYLGIPRTALPFPPTTLPPRTRCPCIRAGCNTLTAALSQSGMAVHDTLRYQMPPTQYRPPSSTLTEAAPPARPATPCHE